MKRSLIRLHLSCLGFTLLLLALGAPVAHAQSRDAAVGPDGVVYMVREGALGELLPEQSAGDADHAILALDLLQPDGTKERLVVPGTRTDDLDVDASVLYEDHSETLFVLWKTEINAIHSSLNLIGLVNGSWSDPIEISGNIFGWKIAPQFAITRDSFEVPVGNGETVVHERTVLHLIWWEPTDTKPVVLYAPIILIDGQYIGWNPVYALDEFDLWRPVEEPSPFDDALAESPTIATGPNDGSVIVAFVDRATGELVTARIDLLPGEIGQLADRARAQIVDLGRDLFPKDIQALADKARAQIVDLGRDVGLHPGLASYVSASVATGLEGADPDGPLESLADKARAQIVDLGSRMTDRGILRKQSGRPSAIIEVERGGRSGSPATEEDGAAVLLQLSLMSHRPAPQTGGDLGSSIFLSQPGNHAVVAWEDEGSIFYRESTDTGWGEVHSLRLTEDLGKEQAYEILRRRARSRTE